MLSPADEIKSRLDIIEVIRQYVPLRPAGLNFVARCPFHNEKTASFNVSPTKQVWHCFGCSKGGDLFSFVMEIEKITFIEALRLLAPKAGVVLKEESGPQASVRNRLLDMHEQAATFYHKILMETPAGANAKKYAVGRGMNKEMVEQWQVGFATDSWDDLTNYLRTKGFKDDEIVLGGLGVKQQNGSRIYNRFRGRLMFPIKEINGNIIGFSGRLLPEYEERDKTQGKYVNSPQSPIYDKGRVLFGLDLAKQSIREFNLAIAVEGQMDCVTAHQFGFANVIASSGTALTAEQGMLIKRFTKRVAFAFDMDAGGRQAVERGAQQAMLLDIEALIVDLPQGKDPDECIRKDFEGWKKSIEHAKPAIQYFLDEQLSQVDLSSASGRRELSEKILVWISRLANSVERDFWLKKLSQAIDSDESSLRESLVKLIKRNESLTPTAIVQLPEQNQEPTSREEILTEQFLALLIAFPELIEGVGPYVSIEQLSGSSLQALYRQLVVYYNKSIARVQDGGATFSYSDFRSWLIAQDFSAGDIQKLDRLAILIEQTFSEVSSDEALRSVKNIQNDLRRSYLNHRLKAVAKIIGELESQQISAERDEKLEVLLREFNDLAEDLRQLSLTGSE